MNVSFELASEKDILSFIRVQNLSFYDDFIKYGYCPGYNPSYDRMFSSIKSRIVYKIILDGKIIGKISVRNDKNGNYFLGCLCVEPSYENRGIGQEAIRFIENKLSDAVRISLETPKENDRNVYFYKRLGYNITKEYMDGPVKIVLFEKNLNDSKI